MFNEPSGLVMTDLDAGRVNPVVGLCGHYDNDRRHTDVHAVQRPRQGRAGRPMDARCDKLATAVGISRQHLRTVKGQSVRPNGQRASPESCTAPERNTFSSGDTGISL